ncbi:hypothetical protein AKG11_31095 [Shinella sp. SUS2]|uniref:hypothetical protein n=1 Tax=unclassified Shinella TaxID=2643062 RepID=UPI00068294B5|nr:MULTISPECIES: hypothetical protein [unclassified Shinella]KNY13118.1 hypothetical protein AKG11_31095 [Shinella sp. SUS2]KOC71903.1 hypothetical protein AKG10_30515 [Shinella sp. GWS1]
MIACEEVSFEAGQVCGRNGCKGIIQQHDSDRGCSCHINPPCGFCTTPREFCEKCGWDAEDDLVVQAEGTIYFAPYVHVEKVRRVLDPSKIDYTISMHSNSSQKVEGVYPPGTTRKDVEAKVEGTFGGRFERFGGGKFTYIAYTD